MPTSSGSPCTRFLRPLTPCDGSMCVNAVLLDSLGFALRRDRGLPWKVTAVHGQTLKDTRPPSSAFWRGFREHRSGA